MHAFAGNTNANASANSNSDVNANVYVNVNAESDYGIHSFTQTHENKRIKDRVSPYYAGRLFLFKTFNYLFTILKKLINKKM